MIKLLILVKKYPTEKEPYALTYVHSRCIEYAKYGIELDILSFDCTKGYTYQDINVVTRSEAALNIHTYSHIVSHAPNLRQHVPFLLKYCVGKKKTFFLHGHEILIKRNHYPEAYAFTFKNKLHKISHQLINNLYDLAKTKILKSLIKKTKNSKFILVSNHLKNIAEIDLNTKFPTEKTSIINNCVNEIFISQSYTAASYKKADFITIRQLDNSTYCLDVVQKLALANPNLTFTIYGKGVFFNYYIPPKNVTIIQSFFKHDQLPEILSLHRAALMPTKHDSQGVMSCEMATFGIPLITSNISVCEEIFSNMPNVAFIDNNHATSLEVLLENLQNNLCPPNKTKFSSVNTIEKELNTIFENK